MIEAPATLPEAVRLFWRHWSPRILAILFAAALALRIRAGDWSAWDAIIPPALLLAWPLQEWLIHVFILHLHPVKVGHFTLDPRVPRKHRAHHRDPYDLDLVFIPVHAYAYAPLVLSLIWFSIAPTLPLALTGIAAHLLLALHYEWVHYLVHTRYIPTSWLYKRLWRNHRLHHFKNENYWYGVSMLAGDVVMRTQPDHKDVPISPTCRDLEAAARS